MLTKVYQGEIEVKEQLEKYRPQCLIGGVTLPEHGRCSLGEGLYVAQDRVAWVDIHRNRIYLHDRVGDRSFDLPVTASLILDGSESQLYLASSHGIGSVDVFTGTYMEKIKFDPLCCAQTHRTNDGCKLSDGRYLVGTMHKSDPGKFSGSVLIMGGNGDISLLCDDIHIPNTFIELDDKSVLVSDSYTGTIFRFTLGDAEKSVSRSVWHQAKEGLHPDGGCRLSEAHLAIAIWEGACIRIFETGGQHLADLAIPAKRPTNVKYNCAERILWVTSASDGLAAPDLERYPLSGKTFQVKDPLSLICN